MIREAVGRSSRLARRLAEISRRRALGEGGKEALGAPGSGGVASGRAGPTDAPGGPGCSPLGIEELLPGGVVTGPQGSVFIHERLRSAIETPRAAWGRLRRSRRRWRRGGKPAPEWLWADVEEPEGNGGAAFAAWGGGDWGLAKGPEAADSPGPPPEASDSETAASADSGAPASELLHRELEDLLRVPFENVVFLDLETGGLSNTCVFLAGTMKWTGHDFVIKQYFARHYGEEEALLHELGAYLKGAKAVITFNGKSFDIPFLRDRAVRHRLGVTIPELHVDLLHHARAAWRGLVPNCRLVTLEAYVCGRRRSGDIPGEEIPGLYHDYVRSGEPHRLIPVFHHNLLDVITMEELLRKVI